MFKIFLLSTLLFSQISFAEVQPGQSAPDFQLTDSNGSAQKLSNFKGKFVVLEWFNKGCPFVKKHYGSSNMQGLQKTYTGKNVVWLTIISSAPGKQGHESGPEANKTKESLGANPTHVLLDSDGKVGKLYGAKTTPHMFIMNPEQKIIYVGAIDDNPSYDPADIPKAKNFVTMTLEAAMNNKPVQISSHKPYGCTVKY